MGASSDPSRTFKNKHMPGHMGAVNTTVLNLEVVKVIAEKNLILIKGGIPGPNKEMCIRDSYKPIGKKRKKSSCYNFNCSST